MNVGITWKDSKGEHRGFTISGGQAHVGHLVELIMANCGTDIRIEDRPRAKHWWETAKDAGWTPPPPDEDEQTSASATTGGPFGV